MAVTLVNRKTGEAYSQVVNDVTRENPAGRDRRRHQPPDHRLVTDGENAYTDVGTDARSHNVVNHSAGEYVNKAGKSSNVTESFFAQLKRSLDGTHHHVSRVHLHRYLAEFDFRHTTHHLADWERLGVYYGGLYGKRLQYNPSSVLPQNSLIG